MRRLLKNARELESVIVPRVAAWMKKQDRFSIGGDFPNIAPLIAELMKSSMHYGAQDMERQVEELRGVRVRRFADWTAVLPEEALSWIDAYMPQLVGVLEDALLEKYRSLIADGMRRGLTNREAVKELGKTFDRFSQFRLETIVRTESMRAYNLGSLIGMKRARGVAGVEFLAIMDERVTPQCEARNGMRLRLDDPHIVNNTPPLHPRCRSMLIPILDDEVEEGWRGDGELAARLEIDEPGIQRPVDIEAVRKVWGGAKEPSAVDIISKDPYFKSNMGWGTNEALESEMMGGREFKYRSREAEEAQRKEIMRRFESSGTPISADDAERIVRYLDDYTAGDYSKVRDWMRIQDGLRPIRDITNRNIEQFADHARWLERFIANSPRPDIENGGLHRGMGRIPDYLENAKVGDVVHSSSMVSATSDFKIAEKFGDRCIVTYENPRDLRGTGVKPFSSNRMEEEYLVSSANLYEILSVNTSPEGVALYRLRCVGYRTPTGLN